MLSIDKKMSEAVIRNQLEYQKDLARQREQPAKNKGTITESVPTTLFIKSVENVINNGKIVGAISIEN